MLESHSTPVFGPVEGSLSSPDEEVRISVSGGDGNRVRGVVRWIGSALKYLGESVRFEPLTHPGVGEGDEGLAEAEEESGVKLSRPIGPFVVENVEEAHPRATLGEIGRVIAPVGLTFNAAEVEQLRNLLREIEKSGPGAYLYQERYGENLPLLKLRRLLRSIRYLEIGSARYEVFVEPFDDKSAKIEVEEVVHA
jgi:hypothetical protein